MKIINATTGKIGHFIIGPKYYFNQAIQLGEAAICIARDEKNSVRPIVWLIGGTEQLIDYISLARTQGELPEEVSQLLLAKIDEIKKNIPRTPHERFASILGIDVSELKESIKLAQVYISDPVAGIQNYSDSKPQWSEKSSNTHASIH